MILIECSNCRAVLSMGHAIFCEDCMEQAEKTIGILEKDIEALKKIVDDLKGDLLDIFRTSGK